jgi:sugar diacid utilization regulator
MKGDLTAQRLLAPGIRSFIAQDTQDGGTLIETLNEYIASDLNVRAAAERLRIHVNTAHYRLGKIAASTDRDLRRIPDLIEILIAARLADR